MADRIRVLMADDHPLFRQGVMELLQERDDIEILAAVSDGEQALERARELQPDVVLLDVHMPGGGGVEAVRAIKEELGTGVLMLTVSSKDDDLLGAIEAGADGYLLKNAEADELFRAIHHVAGGRGALSPEIAGKVMQRATAGRKRRGAENLTPREHEVLDLLAKGLTTAEIARDLVIAQSTVKTHVRHILRKLGASNRTEAVAKAARMGLLNPE